MESTASNETKSQAYLDRMVEQMEQCDSTNTHFPTASPHHGSTTGGPNGERLSPDYRPQPFNNELSVDEKTGVVGSGAAAKCVVCEDESDGLHFGQYTCRACAAFFRRTVSLKLQYTCKHEGRCEIERSARNMCRSCRFNKCLRAGMLTSAVQHSRDGLGKRSKESSFLGSAQSNAVPKVAERPSAASFRTLYASPQGTATILTLSPPPAHGATAVYHMAEGAAATPAGGTTHGATYLGTSGIHQAGLVAGCSDRLASLQFAPTGHMTLPSAFTQFQTGVHHQPQPALLIAPSATTALAGSLSMQHGGSMSYLSRMLDGYNHFVSLRKASYTLVEGLLQFKNSDEIPQSNFGTSKKICKIEASLIMDTVEKFFTPFHTLPAEEKNQLFESFYCLFSNTERAFRTYKTFDADDDRLLMPDGGYIRLSELEKFYQNNSLVRGDPQQVAKIFESAMTYMINVVVAHMRAIEISEMELMTLFGLFIWRDTAELSPESMALVNRTRNQILSDLHFYYRAQGYQEAGITVKVAHLLLLLPKLENSLKLFKENFHIAELFNMMQLDACCNKINNCS